MASKQERRPQPSFYDHNVAEMLSHGEKSVIYEMRAYISETDTLAPIGNGGTTFGAVLRAAQAKARTHGVVQVEAWYYKPEGYVSIGTIVEFKA